MERLVKFARQNRLQPTCNLAKQRQWGGFPIPSDYCSAGPGTYFGTGVHGAVSFASYDMKAENAAKIRDTRIGRVAWVPSVRKCGSTVVQAFFDHVKRTAQSLAKDSVKHPNVWSDEQIARDFFQFTVVREPLSHFLAGAHQLEVFHRMSWIGGTVRRYGINFHNRTCFNTEWGKIPPCDPPYAGPLDLLEAVLDDIERIGFFDEHIFPVTFPIAMSNGMINPVNYYIFDIKNITALENEFNLFAYDESKASARYTSTQKHAMSREGRLPWVTSAKELLEQAETDCRARTIVQRFCRLYAEDYACLPYELPRVCQATVSK